jgi:MFS family permease
MTPQRPVSPGRQADAAGLMAANKSLWPLYAAGFTTAFGAHSIAANLGSGRHGAIHSLLTLGVLLALYDGAEVILKPVFGTLADRIGARPVLLGGLVAFAAASALYAIVDHSDWLWLARLGQGAAASAFSPAASSLVARLNPAVKRGAAFGSYGFYKNLGYTAGPLLGGALVAAAGLRLLFLVLTVLAIAVAVWVQLAVPAAPPLPKQRQTLLDLARRLSEAWFLLPTASLAAATAALAVGVGYLPVSGRLDGLGPVATGAAVSLLALAAAFTQPVVGRVLDRGRLPARSGLLAGLVVTALGVAAAMLSGLAGLLVAAVVIGVGTGIITPLGFATLATHADPARLGQTMGAATLTAGYGTLAAMIGLPVFGFLLASAARRKPSQDTDRR